jgi:hypothetical protein
LEVFNRENNLYQLALMEVLSKNNLTSKKLMSISFLDIGRSSNGRTGAFEASNLGSIPSLPAKIEDF